MSEWMREAGQKGGGVKGAGKRKKRKQADFQEFQPEKEERGEERGGIIYSAEAEPFPGFPLK